MQENIGKKIVNNIKKCGRGTIFFPSSFISYGDIKAVFKSLERLTNNAVIIRLANGIYLYPKIDKKLGLGVLYPSIEDIAIQIAKRDRARIGSDRAYALNLLGLSTQVPMNVVFLTDGSPRKIRLGDDKKITFKHTVPKNLAFVNKTAQLATLALKEIGQSSINEEHLKTLKHVFSAINEKSIEADYKLMPAWIRKIIKDFYSEGRSALIRK
jgi:hypothetical protein